METINLWNKLYLHWRKVTVLLLASLSAFCSFGQITKRINMSSYDDRKMHYGFQLALNNSSFRLKHSDFATVDTTISSITTSNPTSFTLGFIFNYRINDYMDARCLPQVGFYERTIRFTFSDGSKDQFDIFDQTFIEFPMFIKFKSNRRYNHRFYMLGGIKPSIEVGAKKKEKKESQLRTRSFDFGLEYGFGLDRYNELFKFSPEVRFSLGLFNMLLPDDNIYANQFQKISTFTVTFSALFE